MSKWESEMLADELFRGCSTNSIQFITIALLHQDREDTPLPVAAYLHSAAISRSEHPQPAAATTSQETYRSKPESILRTEGKQTIQEQRDRSEKRDGRERNAL